MTQIHIIQSSQSVINFDAFASSNQNLIRAIVSQSGQFSLGHQPPGQWYVKHISTGLYQIVHNLKRLDYGVSAGKYLTNEALTIETSSLNDISFDVKITRDGEPVDRPFEFSVNIYG